VRFPLGGGEGGSFTLATPDEGKNKKKAKPWEKKRETGRGARTPKEGMKNRKGRSKRGNRRVSAEKEDEAVSERGGGWFLVGCRDSKKVKVKKKFVPRAC